MLLHIVPPSAHRLKDVLVINTAVGNVEYHLTASLKVLCPGNGMLQILDGRDSKVLLSVSNKLHNILDLGPLSPHIGKQPDLCLLFILLALPMKLHNALENLRIDR